MSDGCQESDDTAKTGSHPPMMFMALHVMTHALKHSGHVLSRAAMKQTNLKVCKELSGEVHRNIGSCRV